MNLVLLLGSSLARAEGLTDQQIARLRTLSETGQAACASEDYKTCHDSFSEAQRLLPYPPHEYYIAKACVGMGRWVEGSQLWNKILKENDPHDEDDNIREAVRSARQGLTELSPRIPKVLFDLNRDYEQLVVTWDEQELAKRELTDPLPVDPGTHRLEARAPGYQPFSRTLIAEAGQNLNVSLDLIPEPVPPAATDSMSKAPWRTPTGIALLAAGGASLIAGTVVWLDKEDKRQALDRECRMLPQNTDCTADEALDYNGRASEVEDLTLVGNVLLFGGSGLVLGGAGLLLWPDAEEAPAREATRVHAQVGTNQARIWLQGTF